MNLKAEQAEATRTGLLAAARELFAERGYAAVGTEEIVQSARVTRGALYHHFKGKDDLFRAVVEIVEAELTQRIAVQAAEAASGGDPLEALRAGANAFLDASLEPEVQRIIMLDAPAVLGWEAWHEIAERYGLGLTMGVLQVAMDAGAIAPLPVGPLASILIGALDEAAMLVARAEDVEATRREVGETIEALIAGLSAERPARARARRAR
jgi:AcrR family transcriptional regulator